MYLVDVFRCVLRLCFVLFVCLAAVTGYQQPSESASSHTSQFYITILHSNSKEQTLEEKGQGLISNLPLTPSPSLKTKQKLSSAALYHSTFNSFTICVLQCLTVVLSCFPLP